MSIAWVCLYNLLIKTAYVIIIPYTKLGTHHCMEAKGNL